MAVGKLGQTESTVVVRHLKHNGVADAPSEEMGRFGLEQPRIGTVAVVLIRVVQRETKGHMLPRRRWLLVALVDFLATSRSNKGLLAVGECGRSGLLVLLVLCEDRGRRRDRLGGGQNHGFWLWRCWLAEGIKENLETKQLVELTYLRRGMRSLKNSLMGRDALRRASGDWRRGERAAGTLLALAIQGWAKKLSMENRFAGSVWRQPMMSSFAVCFALASFL